MTAPPGVRAPPRAHRHRSRRKARERPRETRRAERAGASREARASRDARRGRGAAGRIDPLRMVTSGQCLVLDESRWRRGLGTRRRTGRLLLRFRPGISTHAEGIDRVAFKPAPYETQNAAMPGVTAADDRRAGALSERARAKRVPPQWRRLFLRVRLGLRPFRGHGPDEIGQTQEAVAETITCVRPRLARLQYCAPEASARRGARSRRAVANRARSRERLPANAMRRARRVSPFASAAAFRSRRF